MYIDNISKNKKKIVIIRICACVLIVLTGFFLMSLMAGFKKPPQRQKPKEKPLSVEVISAAREDIKTFITGFGEVKTLNSVSIATEISGRIIYIHPDLEVGGIVRKGTIIFRIDQADYENNVDTYRKRLKNLKRIMVSNSREALIDEAMNNRPDFKQYIYSVKKADRNIDIAKSGYYPDLNLSYTHSASNNDSFDYKSSDYESKTMLSLSFSIFSGGLTKAEVSEAKAAKREAEKELEDAKITINSNINQALLNFNSALEKYELQKKNLKLFKINRDLVENEYRAGKKSLVSLNEAQKNYMEAKSELLQAFISVKTYMERLDSLTGKNLL